MEYSDKPGDLDVRVADHFTLVGTLIVTLLKKVWVPLRPYAVPGMFLLAAVYFVFKVLDTPASADAHVIGSSILAASLILSATLLLIAQWYFRREP